jgi:hypothetical protein
MMTARCKLSALALAACAILFSARGRADETEQEARFAAPVRISAGGAFVGEGRYYPSPVMHDINGDKRLDVVVGDLRGIVTVAHRVPGAKSPFALGKEMPLLNRDKRQLKFHNW